MTWWMIDSLIVLGYGLLHSFLTTRPVVNLYNKILPDYSWNFVYSTLSVAAIVVGFKYWQSSNVVFFHLTPGSLSYHISLVVLAGSLFFFFYCFKFTTSFWQWLGVKQLVYKVMKKPMPAYYRTRKSGIKRYIRFPHHSCLIVFFWAHPVMTLDIFLLAVGATVYLYVGTYHQDLRGLRVIGEEWKKYRENTVLLIPNLALVRRMIADWKASFDSPTGENGAVTDTELIKDAVK